MYEQGTRQLETLNLDVSVELSRREFLIGNYKRRKFGHRHQNVQRDQTQTIHFTKRIPIIFSAVEAEPH